MENEKPSPFADLLSGCVWVALTAGIMVLSWKMDRLVHLQASIYTAPGVVPGLLGLALAIMGLLLILRSVRAGAIAEAHLPAFSFRHNWRILTAVALCLTFALGLVGSGLPFWLAAAIFIAVFVFVFEYEDRKAAGTLARGAAFAAVFGLMCGGAIHYVFQDLFLVRLP